MSSIILTATTDKISSVHLLMLAAILKTLGSQQAKIRQ